MAGTNKLPVGLPRAMVGYVLLAAGVWWLWHTGAVLILLGLSLVAAGFAQGRGERKAREGRQAHRHSTPGLPRRHQQ